MRVEVKKGALQWRYRIISSNGQILSVSQRYFSKGNAVRAAKRLAEHIGAEFSVAA